MSHYEELAERNVSEGLQVIFVYLSDIVTISDFPIFIPLVLFAFFIIVAGGSYFSRLRTGGVDDWIVSFTVASFVTTTFAFLLSLIEGLIDTKIILILISITTISVVALFFTKDN